MGQVKLANHDFDVDSEIIFLAENLDHAATRILRGTRPVGDLHIDDHAFQILPVGMHRGFLAYHPVAGFFPLCPLWPLRWF
jgi:hypothetical protein